MNKQWASANNSRKLYYQYFFHTHFLVFFNIQFPFQYLRYSSSCILIYVCTRVIYFAVVVWYQQLLNPGWIIGLLHLLKVKTCPGVSIWLFVSLKVIGQNYCYKFIPSGMCEWYNLFFLLYNTFQALQAHLYCLIKYSCNGI